MKKKSHWIVLFILLMPFSCSLAEPSAATTQFLQLVGQCREALTDPTKFDSFVTNGWEIDKPEPNRPAFRKSFNKQIGENKFNIQFNNFSAVTVCRAIMFSPHPFADEALLWQKGFGDRTRDAHDCSIEEQGAILKEGELLPKFHVQYYMHFDPRQQAYIVAIEMQKIKSTLYQYYSVCEEDYQHGS